ncbi:hypothetical protein LZ32DRAFT_45150 [Colletotrichum eremochloae]|nr:hypothetical protein LZ32DRAFT_45150 [Colletotrichum eremochloae]
MPPPGRWGWPDSHPAFPLPLPRLHNAAGCYPGTCSRSTSTSRTTTWETCSEYVRRPSCWFHIVLLLLNGGEPQDLLRCCPRATESRSLTHPSLMTLAFRGECCCVFPDQSDISPTTTPGHQPSGLEPPAAPPRLSQLLCQRQSSPPNRASRSLGLTAAMCAYFGKCVPLVYQYGNVVRDLVAGYRLMESSLIRSGHLHVRELLACDTPPLLSAALGIACDNKRSHSAHFRVALKNNARPIRFKLAVYGTVTFSRIPFQHR